MTTDEPSESERDTLPAPRDIDEMFLSLEKALGESNALMIQTQQAASRAANQCVALMQALREERRERLQLQRRVERLESHLNLEPLGQ